MSLGLMIRDERRDAKIETRIEDILSLLEDLGPIPTELRERLMTERDLKLLTKWFKLAARAESVEDFMVSI